MDRPRPVGNSAGLGRRAEDLGATLPEESFDPLDRRLSERNESLTITLSHDPHDALAQVHLLDAQPHELRYAKPRRV